MARCRDPRARLFLSMLVLTLAAARPSFAETPVPPDHAEKMARGQELFTKSIRGILLTDRCFEVSRRREYCSKPRPQHARQPPQGRRQRAGHHALAGEEPAVSIASSRTSTNPPCRPRKPSRFPGSGRGSDRRLD